MIALSLFTGHGLLFGRTEMSPVLVVCVDMLSTCPCSSHHCTVEAVSGCSTQGYPSPSPLSSPLPRSPTLPSFFDHFISLPLPLQQEGEATLQCRHSNNLANQCEGGCEWQRKQPVTEKVESWGRDQPRRPGGLNENERKIEGRKEYKMSERTTDRKRVKIEGKQK